MPFSESYFLICAHCCAQICCNIRDWKNPRSGCAFGESLFRRGVKCCLSFTLWRWAWFACFHIGSRIRYCGLKFIWTPWMSFVSFWNYLHTVDGSVPYQWNCPFAQVRDFCMITKAPIRGKKWIHFSIIFFFHFFYNLCFYFNVSMVKIESDKTRFYL